MKKKVIKSKIVCTMGPASNSREVLSQMVEAGMDCARLNFSHGTHEEHIKTIKLIRGVSDRIAILCDIQGPKIRTGEMEKPVVLRQGERITLTSRDVIGTEQTVSVSYKRLPEEVKKGDKIFLNDGIIMLQVLDVCGKDIDCEIIAGGDLSSRKGINLPSSEITMGIPTKKDEKDLKAISKMGIEYVAASFVGKAEDVARVREILDADGESGIKIISKIERPVAIDNFDSILEVSDGIMVARGDLGVEIAPEKVPEVQKRLISKCNRESKLAIVATQMLESMIHQPVPTRAETNDVFNAIIDGADAVMLSGETSVGKYPVGAVKIMDRIVETAENIMPKKDPDYYDSEHQTIAEVLGHAVYTVVNEFRDQDKLDKVFILTITKGGHSARMISKYRPQVPIIAATPDKRVSRQLQLLWGVDTILFNIDARDSTETMIKKALSRAREEGYCVKDDYVITVSSSSFAPGKTRLLGVFKVSDILKT